VLKHPVCMEYVQGLMRMIATHSASGQNVTIHVHIIDIIDESDKHVASVTFRGYEWMTALHQMLIREGFIRPKLLSASRS